MPLAGAPTARGRAAAHPRGAALHHAGQAPSGVLRRSHATPLLTGRRPATRAPAGSSGIWRTAAPSRRPPCSAPSRRPGGMTRCVTARADSDGAAGTRNRVRTRRTSRRRSGPAGPRPPSNHSRCGLFAGSPRAPAARQAPQRGHRADAAGLSRRVPRWPPNWTRPHPSAAASLREGLDETLTVLRLGVPPTLARTLRSTIASMISIWTTERRSGHTGRHRRWEAWMSGTSRVHPRQIRVSGPLTGERGRVRVDRARSSLWVPRTLTSPLIGAIEPARPTSQAVGAEKLVTGADHRLRSEDLATVLEPMGLRFSPAKTRMNISRSHEVGQVSGTYSQASSRPRRGHVIRPRRPRPPSAAGRRAGT